MIDTNKLKNAGSGAFPDGLSPADIAIAKLKADLAVYVFKHRESAGLTQKQFAEKYGISQSTVSKVENGDDNVSLRAVVEISTALGFELKLEKRIEKSVVGTASVIQLSTYQNNRRVIVSKDNYFRGASSSLLEYERKEM